MTKLKEITNDIATVKNVPKRRVYRDIFAIHAALKAKYPYTVNENLVKEMEDRDNNKG